MPPNMIASTDKFYVEFVDAHLERSRALMSTVLQAKRCCENLLTQLRTYP